MHNSDLLNELHDLVTASASTTLDKGAGNVDTNTLRVAVASDNIVTVADTFPKNLQLKLEWFRDSGSAVNMNQNNSVTMKPFYWSNDQAKDVYWSGFSLLFADTIALEPLDIETYLYSSSTGAADHGIGVRNSGDSAWVWEFGTNGMFGTNIFTFPNHKYEYYDNTRAVNYTAIHEIKFDKPVIVHANERIQMHHNYNWTALTTAHGLLHIFVPE